MAELYLVELFIATYQPWDSREKREVLRRAPRISNPVIPFIATLHVFPDNYYWGTIYFHWVGALQCPQCLQSLTSN